jgi:nicotinamidase-related amidase
MRAKATAAPARSLLAPGNFTLAFIDQQHQMAFGVGSMDRTRLVNNVVGLAKGARLFEVPTILTTVEAASFSGPIFSELQQVFPKRKPLDRSTVNAWEDERFVREVERIGRRRLVLSGLWTTVCVALPALSALEAGYQVYVVTDTCGDVDRESHERGLERTMMAGAIPVTWLQVVLELQRDWARKATYRGTLEIIKEHAGAYGLGIEYAEAMLKGFGR